MIKKEGQDFIRDLLKNKPDLILDEICIEYNNNFEPAVSRSTINRALIKMKITHKTLFDGRKNTQEKLKFYQNDIIIFNPEQLIFIDEMGVNENITICTFRKRYSSQKILLHLELELVLSVL